MADEATVRSSLQIKKSAADGTTLKEERPQPTAFKVDVALNEGPTPGGFLASTAGTNVDLTALTTPGLCRLMNRDDTNYVEVGIWDPTGVVFYPMLEVGPGESYIIKLARNIRQETGTGDPGTAPLDTDNKLRVKAISAACQVTVEAHGK